MKNYNFLMIGLLFTSTVSFAQQSRMISNEVPMKPISVSAEELKIGNVPLNAVKAPGDTLWYEDFGNGLSTNGWVSNHPGSLGFDWIYTTSAPGGQYSTNVTAMNSVTATNGFISLPSDLYNTPSPGAGFLPMGTTITSGPITINPVGNVLLRWRQTMRYCCIASEQLELQVSNDGINFVSYDAKFGRQPNVIAAENAEINISAVAAGQGTIYLRFFQSSSHYYWMIDDIAIVEGVGNQLKVEDAFSTFGTGQYEGYYTITPLVLTQPLSFEMAIQNDGGFDATNVAFSTIINQAGVGDVYTDTSAVTPVIASPLNIDTLQTSMPFANTSGLGDYVATLRAFSDSASIDPTKTVYSFPWSVSDTVFAKDLNVSGGNSGPGSFQFGDVDGSKIGTKYTLKNTQTVTSLSFFISTDPANTGAEMKAQVWGFDTSQATVDLAITTPGLKAQNPIPYVIQASDLGTWVTIPMIPAVSLPAGQYVVVAEQSAGNLNGFQMFFGRSLTAERFQPYSLNFSSFVYVNDATPTWGNAFVQPMMRMNFGLLAPPIGVEEAAKSIEGFTVAPNPNNGQFNVVVTAEKANFNLNVRNMVGQVVYNEAITVNNTLTKNIDLSNLNKGIYFVSIENGVNRKVQKVIIK
mgnify:CR=1 FL=1